MSVTQWLTLLLLNIVGAVSPGPDVILILRTAIRSRRHALMITLGIQTGVVLWCTLTVLGAAAVLNAFPELLGIIQIVGGGWLGYMGQAMMRSGWAQRLTPPTSLADAALRVGSLGSTYRMGLATNLSNPKVVLFMAALIAPLLPASPSVGLTVMTVLALWVSSLVAQLIIASLASARAVRQRLLRAAAYIDLGAGMFFLVAGIALVVAGLGGILG